MTQDKQTISREDNIVWGASRNRTRVGTVHKAADGRAIEVMFDDAKDVVGVEAQSASVAATQEGDRVLGEHVPGFGIVVTHRLLADNESPAMSQREGRVAIHAEHAIKLSVGDSDLSLDSHQVTLQATRARFDTREEYILSGHPLSLNPPESKGKA